MEVILRRKKLWSLVEIKQSPAAFLITIDNIVVNRIVDQSQDLYYKISTCTTGPALAL
jgi:hypothetical protein